MKYKVAVIIGSLRKESYNRRLANALIKSAQNVMDCEIVEIGNLPLYNQDFEDTPGQAVIEFKEKIFNKDGVIFVTPEYNRSIPGVLKNAIDIGSRPKKESVWSRRPAGIIGCSPGPIGTALAQQHLRNILAHLDMPTLGQPEFFLQVTDGTFLADGSLAEKSQKHLERWIESFALWLQIHTNK
ncbi:MAG TPA: NAD(P)H-dependent oxidoreductase [Pyrinomonadaceae bacterium]|nr:NAD(P)H-dependent oxidoreductase [Pyrinomonadaceae bacterium]